MLTLVAIHLLYDNLQARELYSCVCELQPLASQGWLEWSKMEEECGQVQCSLQILRRGKYLREEKVFLLLGISSSC